MSNASRAEYLAILRTQVANEGLTGEDLQEVYERLEATDTAILKEAVETHAVDRARALRNAPQGSCG